MLELGLGLDTLIVNKKNTQQEKIQAGGFHPSQGRRQKSGPQSRAVRGPSLNKLLVYGKS